MKPGRVGEGFKVRSVMRMDRMVGGWMRERAKQGRGGGEGITYIEELPSHTAYVIYGLFRQFLGRSKVHPAQIVTTVR